MPRISLVEQYDNKDVITQIYDIKDNLDGALAELENATEVAGEAADAATRATDAANNAVDQVNQLTTRTTVLEGYVGAPSDTASATGSVYARIAADKANTDTNTGNIATLQTTVGNHTTAISGLQTTVNAIPTTYQAKSEKNQLNGYAGLTSSGKVATTQLDTGVNLNQILQAGAQLNTGEFLYIGPGGTIRSRIIGEGVEYVGNYSSLAALEAYPDPRNGDFGTVYGTVSDDGFYMYDGTNWNLSALFDATDYELIANKVTGISSASTNSEYPSAKAVYDYDVANDVAGIGLTQNTVSGKVTVTATVTNANSTTIATDSVDIATTNSATAADYKPITSDGVASIVTTLNGNITSAVSGKQDTLTSATITLAAANWSSNAQTITGISQVTATNIVWVSPSSASFDEYGECGIRVTAQASGSLTFTTNGTDPTNDLTVVVVGA